LIDRSLIRFKRYSRIPHFTSSDHNHFLVIRNSLEFGGTGHIVV